MLEAAPGAPVGVEAVDGEEPVHVCPTCQGRMKLLGLVKNPVIISHTLATLG